MSIKDEINQLASNSSSGEEFYRNLAKIASRKGLQGSDLNILRKAISSDIGSQININKNQLSQEEQLINALSSIINPSAQQISKQRVEPEFIENKFGKVASDVGSLKTGLERRATKAKNVLAPLLDKLFNVQLGGLTTMVGAPRAARDVETYTEPVQRLLSNLFKKVLKPVAGKTDEELILEALKQAYPQMAERPEDAIVMGRHNPLTPYGGLPAMNVKGVGTIWIDPSGKIRRK